MTIKFVIAGVLDKTFRVLLNPPVNVTQIEGTDATDAIQAAAAVAIAADPTIVKLESMVRVKS